MLQYLLHLPVHCEISSKGYPNRHFGMQRMSGSTNVSWRLRIHPSPNYTLLVVLGVDHLTFEGGGGELVSEIIFSHWPVVQKIFLGLKSFA